MGLICVTDELGVEGSVMVRPVCTAYIDLEMNKFHQCLVSYACVFTSECLFPSPPSSSLFTMRRPVRKRISFDKKNDTLFGLLKGCSTGEVAQQMHVCQSSVQRIHQKRLPLMEVSIGRKPTKVSKGIRKACLSVVTVGGLDSTIQAIKFVNEQMQENVSVQTVRRILQVASL
jgi:hypothetical protein